MVAPQLIEEGQDEDYAQSSCRGYKKKDFVNEIISFVPRKGGYQSECTFINVFV